MNSQIRIAFIDLDGTLIRGQSQALFISFLRKKGLIGRIKSFIILLWFFLYKINITKKTEWILSFTLSCFKNMPSDKIYVVIDEFISKVIRKNYYKDVERFLIDLKSKKIKLVILSTAINLLVDRIARDLHIDSSLSTTVEISNNKFTGKIHGDHLYGLNKLTKIYEYIDKENIKMEDVLVVADNYSDKEILIKAGMGIVANPNTEMELWSLQNNMPMIYLDKYESIQYI